MRVNLVLAEGAVVYSVVMFLIDRQSVFWTVDMLRAIKRKK